MSGNPQHATNTKLDTIEPNLSKKAEYEAAYGNWKSLLDKFI